MLEASCKLEAGCKIAIKNYMENIVIVGAGFGGLTVALGLEKQFRRDKNISLTLVDRNDYHLFTPNLYEVASAEEEFVSARQLKKSIALPIKEILRGRNIAFLKGELKLVDQLQKKTVIDSRELEYDYLILALGSRSEYFAIEGAKKYALPFKDLKDAFRIKNQIEFAVQLHRQDAIKKVVRVVIAGGGYAGVELAGELTTAVSVIAWKNNYPLEKIELQVVEAANKLISGFNDNLSKDALLRLKELGVRVSLTSAIVRADPYFLSLSTGEKIAYDVLVWTAGVRAESLPFEHKVATDSAGRIRSNAYLQAQDWENIFVIGDECRVLDEAGNPAASSAQDAIRQGRYLAEALPKIMQNQRPQGFTCQKHGYIVNIGGKWAILNIGRFYFKGFLAYFIHQLAHINYFRTLIGWRRAIFYVLFEVKIFSRND